MKDFENLTEQFVKSEKIYDGHLLHIYKDTVTLPNGAQATREYFKHMGAVAIVPITEDGKVALEKQYRYPVDRIVTEIPAGKLNGSSEDPLAAAKRELQEETGLVCDKWTDLGIYQPAVAYCDEVIYLYLAQGLHEEERNLDEDEFLNVEYVPLKEAVDMVIRGDIKDGKTQVALMKAAVLLGDLK